MIAAALAGWLFIRVPWMLPVAVLACAPARIPVSVGATKANLLLPLYLVVAGAAVALGAEIVFPERFARWRAGKIFEPRGRHAGEPAAPAAPPDRERPVLGAFAWPAALLIGWSGICLLWSRGPPRRRDLPALLHAPAGPDRGGARPAPVADRLGEGALRRARRDGARLRRDRRRAVPHPDQIDRNLKVNVDNAYAPVGWYFRVNSVFYDPSIYGRFLVVAILASLVLVLFERSG